MSTSFPTDTPAKKVAEVDLSGRELGQFRLLRRLGRGAMADVYLAEQSALKRWVAIKILKPELADDKVYLKRFEREAQAAASLVHANIVQIHEVGHVENYRYIVQEYVQGQNLREYLSRSGPPDLPHTLSIMCQVVAALAKAAERGVVHRDIKPENIMLTRAGEVKVADFGLARVSREGEAADLTQVGITMGTPLYMSPEQVEGKLLDPRSDIYSFGVTCYHMLSGSPPFSGETALGVAVQHLKVEPQRLEIVRPDLPAALCRVVHKMLAKSPKDRYQSARELLRELRRLQLEQCGDNWPEDLPGWESVGFDLPDDPRISTARQLDGLMKTLALVRPRRRNRLWLGAGVAVALVCFVCGGLAAWFAVAQPPLLPPEPRERLPVPRQSTVLRQWYYASKLGTEEAWQSVSTYFPDNDYYVRRAKEQLAQIYLREENYGRAKDLFEEFARAEDSEEELRAFGLAGLCVVLTLEGKYHESAETLNQLLPIRGKLQSEWMQVLLEFVIQKNAAGLGGQTPEEWKQWAAERLRQGG